MGAGISGFGRAVKRLALCTALWLALAASASGQLAAVIAPSGSYEPGLGRPDAPFVPTPMKVVEGMLRAAGVGASDVVYDLGSGDGRVVIMAARKFKSRAVGIEIDPKLARRSAERITALSLEKRASIRCEDMFTARLGDATVVALYQFAQINERLRPRLEAQLRPGTRVVTHDFEMPGWTPRAVRDILSENKLPHKVYLYVRP